MNKLVYRFKHTSLKVKWALAAGSAIFLAFFLFSFFQYHAIDKWLINEEESSFGRVLDEMAMAAPLTVDNFEGMAVVPRSAGGIRVYLLSDDNGSAAQHTYLLAFDWQPAS